MDLVQAHKCPLLFMGPHIFQIKVHQVFLSQKFKKSKEEESLPLDPTGSAESITVLSTHPSSMPLGQKFNILNGRYCILRILQCLTVCLKVPKSDFIIIFSAKNNCLGGHFLLSLCIF